MRIFFARKTARLSFILLSLALTGGFLSACAQIPPPAATLEKPADIGDALLRLEPGDQVNILVYGEDELSDVYRLDEDGNINLPLAGRIKAGGMTKAALQNTVRDRLIEGEYQTNPHVTVEVEALRPFYIIGEVNAPGSYPYQPSLDTFQAIAVAGGFTPRAAHDKILITRTRQGERFRFYASENTPIWPGDSITVYQRLF